MSGFFGRLEDSIGKMRDDACEVVVPALEELTPMLQIGGPEVDYDNIKNQAQAYYSSVPKEDLEDGDLHTPQLIAKYGYDCETHLVITDDGYILALHRIPLGKNKSGPPTALRKPALLVHGLMSSSADWVIPGPEKALAYILADNGYDVWLVNCRGNTYSRNHTFLRTEDSAFWDFSFHEIAYYDIAACIDHVLQTTKHEKLYYVGHSQGTTVSYTLCATRPEYNSKIAVSCCLAPIGFMDHMKSPIMRIVDHLCPTLECLTAIIGDKEFLPNSALLRELGKYIPTTGGPVDVLLTNALFACCGYDPNQIDLKLIPSMMGHDPAGDSTKQMIHYAQEMRSKKYRQYDYEATENVKRYGTADPPEYKLENITAPHILYYSDNDWISSPIDVDRFMNGIVNCPKKEKVLVYDGKFNHTDYLYAKDAPTLLYNQLMEKLKAF